MESSRSMPQTTTDLGRAEEFTTSKAGTVLIDPMGPFVSAMSRAYGTYLERNQGARPLDEHMKDVQIAHPEWEPKEIAEAAAHRQDAQVSELVAGFMTDVLGTENLLYELAGLAVGHDKEWAEHTLYPDELLKIVDRASRIGRLEDYLGESITFPASVIAPEVAKRARAKAKQAAITAAAKIEIGEQKSDDSKPTPNAEQAPGSSGTSEPSSPETSTSGQANGSACPPEILPEPSGS